MSIFGFGKKKEEQKQSCCCGGNCTPETMQVAEAEKKESGIKILGGGCAKCNALEAATEEALRELGMDATIDHVRDFEKIAAYGVMTTPALVLVPVTCAVSILLNSWRYSSRPSALSGRSTDFSNSALLMRRL